MDLFSPDNTMYSFSHSNTNKIVDSWYSNSKYNEASEMEKKLYKKMLSSDEDKKLAKYTEKRKWSDQVLNTLKPAGYLTTSYDEYIDPE